LLAHVLVSKYADHCPLYRQSCIYEREGINLDRSTLADWVGRSTSLLEPLADAIGRHVRAGQATFANDTPLKMQAKVNRKTARIWAYVRDKRSWKSQAPPAAWYRFSTDRKGTHPADHLSHFKGWVHADGYSGFNELYRAGNINEVSCLAHIRRKFSDVFQSDGSVIAEEVIRRIAMLYVVEMNARGQASEDRVRMPRAHSKSIDAVLARRVAAPAVDRDSYDALRLDLATVDRPVCHLSFPFPPLQKLTVVRDRKENKRGRMGEVNAGTVS